MYAYFCRPGSFAFALCARNMAAVSSMLLPAAMAFTAKPGFMVGGEVQPEWPSGLKHANGSASDAMEHHDSLDVRTKIDVRRDP